MNRQLVIGVVVGALAVTTFGAVAGYRLMDQKEFAAVQSVKPATYTAIVPRERCIDEQTVPGKNSLQETVRKCRTTMESSSEPAGYDVVYRFKGRDEFVHMDYDPGRQIPMENGAPVLQR